MLTRLKFWLSVIITLNFFQSEILAVGGDNDNPPPSSSSSAKKVMKENDDIRVSTSLLSQKPKPKETFILSLDGHGIQGIIAARLLFIIEQRLSTRYGKPVRLSTLFDIITGCSTGGLTALSMASPKVIGENDDFVEDYWKNNGQIDGHKVDIKYLFDGIVKGYPADMLIYLCRKYGKETSRQPECFWERLGYLGYLFWPRYKADKLDDILIKYFKGNTFKEATTRVLIPVHDLVRNKTVILDSDKADYSTQNYNTEDVARSTFAAPTFFAAKTIKTGDGIAKTYVDGGVTLCNPTAIAFKKARDEPAGKFFIVSLGTGKIDSPPSLFDLRNSGAIRWASPLISLGISAATERVNEQMEFEQKYAGQHGIQMEYIRIQPKIEPLLAEMYQISDINIEALKNKVDDILEKKEDKVTRIISRLMERYDERETAQKESLEADVVIFNAYLNNISKNLVQHVSSLPSIYLSHYREDTSSNNQADEIHRGTAVKALALDLTASGIPWKNIFYCSWTNRPGGAEDIFAHADKIGTAKKVILIGSPELKQKYEIREGIETQEINILRERIINKGIKGIIPVWFEGSFTDNFPSYFQALPSQSLIGDYYVNFFELLINIYQLNPLTNFILDEQKNFKRIRKASPDAITYYTERLAV